MALNSLFMAIIVGALTTVLGLVFALLVTRTNLKFGRVIRAMSVRYYHSSFCDWAGHYLLFGLSGIVTTFMADVLGLLQQDGFMELPGSYSCPNAHILNCLSSSDWGSREHKPFSRKT